MVRGLQRFRDHFGEFGDRYVLIGGTACDLTMTEAGLEFRVTRDFDIVLRIEALDRDFAVAFWSFVRQGGYRQKETSTGKRIFYRFQNPTEDTYPAMIELFSRRPEALVLAPDTHLTPIPVEDAVSSLSAILLNAEYYQWIHDGKVDLQGLPTVRAEHLIPLKARAWIDLTERKASGGQVDRGAINKHKRDVLRLAQIIDPEYAVSMPAAIGSDMARFVAEAAIDGPDLASLKTTADAVAPRLDVIRTVYQIT